MAKKSIKARVTVYPRPEILDPQGKAIGDALGRIGFGQVRDVRAGKSFEIDLEGVTKKDAPGVLEEMCEKLLANLLVEDYRIELIDGKAAS